MSAESKARAETRCPQCSAPMSTSIDGLCAACLMRLATGDSLPGTDDDPALAPPPAGYVDWLKLRGQRIGNYQLLDEIARGGMGIVYRARQLNAGRVVALKVMLPHLLPLPGMLERFRREVEAAARLDHPGILPIYEVGEHAGLPYFSMKMAEGGSLDRRAADMHGDWPAIAALVAKIARAVEHAHRNGILHRDLKPANILFDQHGEPMVADFGLAKFQAVESGLTLPASALGSPNYMAPEQISAQFGEIGPGADVYGLGAILYQLLTGQPPIAGEDAIATMRLVTTQQPASGVHTRPDMPPDLDAIALKCLAKNAAERYASPAALANDLERWSAGRETEAHIAARVRRRQRIALRAAVVLLAVGSATGAWFAVQSTAHKPDQSATIATTAAPRSIGVLPFRNVGADPDDDYLGSMVTDDLLRELRQVESLSVVPFRLEAAAGAGSEELSRRLGVDVLLDGEFAQRGNVLNVRARLWDASANRTIWQHSFDAPAADVREMRSQIATALVTRLQIATGEDLRAQLLTNALTDNPEAYRKYLRARYLLRWRRTETLGEAARLLRDAIDLDPRFGRAHSALAYVYSLWVPPEPPEGDHWTLTLDFARSALALDPRLGEPHAVVGNYHDIHGKPVEAELALRRALELDPRDPATLHYFAIHLYSVGRLHDALEMERRSVALDGRSPQPMMWLAMLTTAVGERSEALRLWEQADELGAARPFAAAIARLGLGQTEYLAEWYRTTLERTGVPAGERDPGVLLAGVLDPSRRVPALEWLRRVEPHVDPAFAITHYALLGDTESAVRLARTYELTQDFWYLYRLCNIWSPRTATLRRDPRFASLLMRWGFVDYWQRFGNADTCKVTDGSASCQQ